MNVACILILMIFGCHNVIMSNQSTFVLGYLLLQGYDVSGHAYVLRVISLLIGMGICMAVFYKNQKTVHTAGRSWICSGNLMYVPRGTGGILS